MRDHRLIDERSLAFARAIADRLHRDPSLISFAIGNIKNWMNNSSLGVQRTLQEWLAILNGPIDGVFFILTGEDERSVRLRQSNPFAGLLPQQERNEILLRFEERDKAAT